MKLIISEQQYKKLIESQLTIPDIPNTITFWHGGNLDDYSIDPIAQKTGRYEYGPGLYLITKYSEAIKYAKGSRKLYMVTVKIGNDINSSSIPYQNIENFINKYAIQSKRKELIERLKTKVSEHGLVPAYIFNNLIINYEAVKPANTKFQRKFYIDNNIDYDIIDNPFGWNDAKMMVLYNMSKIVQVQKVNPKDTITKFDIHENNINEVKYIKTPDFNKNSQYENEPLNDNDTIRVYHGFNSIQDAIMIAKQGLSGKSDARAHKIYSYETGNNPYGLFVSVNFNVIKNNFAYGGVIMEFSTKVSDLEAPVWKGQNSYFGQGSYTKTFTDKQERETQRINYRNKAIQDYQNDKSLNNITKSTRPELAQSLIDSPEKQAIFVGDLNPNMIKRFWVHENIINNKITTGNFVPLSRENFLKLYGNKNISQYTKEKHETTYLKLFYPNDNYNMDYLNPMEKIKSEKLQRYAEETKKIVTQLNSNDNVQNEYGEEIPVSKLRVLQLTLWPKQIIQAIGKDNYNKYYNEFL